MSPADTPDPGWYFLGRSHPERMTPDEAARLHRVMEQVTRGLADRGTEALAAWNLLARGQYSQLETDPVPPSRDTDSDFPNLTRWGQGLTLELVPVIVKRETECGVCGRLILPGAPALAFAYTSPRDRVWVYRLECPLHFGTWLAEKEGVRLKRRRIPERRDYAEGPPEGPGAGTEPAAPRPITEGGGL